MRVRSSRKKVNLGHMQCFYEKIEGEKDYLEAEGVDKRIFKTHSGKL